MRDVNDINKSDLCHSFPPATASVGAGRQCVLVEEIIGPGLTKVGSPGLTLSETDAQYVREIVEEALENCPQI